MKTTHSAPAARLSTTSTAAGIPVVMIHSDSKSAAQQALRLAKTWIWAEGGKLKVVYFNEIVGTEWSSLGRRYVARVAYRMAVAS